MKKDSSYSVSFELVKADLVRVSEHPSKIFTIRRLFLGIFGLGSKPKLSLYDAVIALEKIWDETYVKSTRQINQWFAAKTITAK
ncbi:hypothetical protein [Leisingera daeponensis]|uniref:hypothetical protein n=1 Tax=Leisingera daeponensis TaxID=405746 RepID=UPI001C956272|nr:hypothetical protein [Leisingera daeponensis]MBY6058753.1 hypothetical protein [Leisingera daeponensis]